MDPQVLNHAQQVAADVMSNVSSEQLDLPTPCDNWNVGQLIDHLVGAQHWAASGIRGSEMRDAAGASQGDFNGAFQAAAQDALDAFSEDGAMERTVNPGFGDKPATGLLGLAVAGQTQRLAFWEHVDVTVVWSSLAIAAVVALACLGLEIAARRSGLTFLFEPPAALRRLVER